MDSQTHLIYLLLDSNLPTGGFVASSGLESWAKHGFLSHQPSYPSSSSSSSASASSVPIEGPTRPSPAPTGQTISARRVTDFLDAEVENYALSTGIYVHRAWKVVSDTLDRPRTRRCRRCNRDRRASSATVSSDENEEEVERCLQAILALDQKHESTLLSHVSRRASKAQGVAILTLYTKGLSRPPGYRPPQSSSSDGMDQGAKQTEEGDRDGAAAAAIVEGYKRLIRQGKAPGHLAVCWGVMMAALGLSLAYHLYLFLHVRSLLSAAIRLNLIGPYLSSQLLLHPARTIIERYSAVDVKEAEGNDEPCSCSCEAAEGDEGVEVDQETDFWAWTADAEKGPATTWPLGEVLVGRHDLQHSRIFNS